MSDIITYMEIIITGIFMLVIFGMIKSFLSRYNQHQIIKKLKELVSVLEKEDKQTPTKDFLYFLSKNTHLPQDEYFRKELEQFVNLYSKNYIENISIKNIFLVWISILENNILYTPDKNLSIKEYQNIYEIENNNIFEKIANQYKEDIISDIDNVSNKKKFFYLKVNNSIELFLNKYTKESDSLLPFYWFPFSSIFLNKISKIDYKTWFTIKKCLKI